MQYIDCNAWIKAHITSEEIVFPTAVGFKKNDLKKKG